MIDIVFDSKADDTFCGEMFPCVDIKAKMSSWTDYMNLAQNFIKSYSEHKSVIVKSVDKDFSINKFSVALFAESIQNQSNLDYVVFKVKDLEKSRESYKPYLALTIAVKYVLQLIDKTPEEIYRNISDLGYLGLDIKSDYLKNMMSLKYKETASPKNKYKAHNAFEALVLTALLKTVSLAKIQACFEVEIDLNNTPKKIDVKCLVEEIMRKVSPWVH